MCQSVAVRTQDHNVLNFGTSLTFGNRVEVMHVQLRIDLRHEATCHAFATVVF